METVQILFPENLKASRGGAERKGALVITTATATRTGQKSNRFSIKTTTLHLHHPFLYFSLVLQQDYDMKT